MHTFAICAYKESPYLEECILSLKAQTVQSGIIVVTSTPNDHIRRLAEKYHLPYFVNRGEAGITQDWNFGYEMADSKYITIAHQDDIYERTYLETALRSLGSTERPLIFFSGYYEIRNGEKKHSNRLLRVKRLMLLPLRFRGLRGAVQVRRGILALGNPICCPAVTFAAENLPFPVFRNHFQVCEDWEAWEMISRMRGAFLYDAGRLVGHRIHADSETSAAIENHRRSKEEYEMFCRFWLPPIAGFLSRIYSSGQHSNRL